MSNQGWRLRAAGAVGFVLVAVLAAGCGEDTAVTGFTGFDGQTAPEMTIDLASATGGLTPTAEKPAFGDPYIAGYLDGRDEAPTQDPLVTDSRMADMESRSDVEVRYLRVVWGNMNRGPEADAASAYDGPVLDWSGKATVSDGVLIPLRTIQFERNDHIVPRWLQEDPSRQKVEWVSHTGPGKDGILFAIVIPPAGDGTLAGQMKGAATDGLTEDDVFVFDTGLAKKEIKISAIQDTDELVMVDDANGVSFTGFDREDLDACPRGAMDGVWVRVENDDHLGGFFRARLAGPLGGTVGHVRGRWGVLDGGEKVFVGKIIGPRGDFLGFMRGQWDRNPDAPGRGTYNGLWNVDGRAHGMVRGQWRLADRVADGGFLRGLWAVNCNQDGGGA